ncbi:metal-dependent hydrolase, partial [Burkholderia pyrrocinia]
GLTSREIVRRGIGRTFQHVKLLPGMTVLENVALGAHLRGTTGVWRSIARLNVHEEAQLLAEAARQIRRVGLEKHMYDEA